MTSKVYSGLFVLLIFLWPLILTASSDVQTQTLFWPIMIVNALIGILVWYYNSVNELSFYKGLSVISGSLMSGCANITLLYLPFVLAVVYFIAAFNTLIGLFIGRESTQKKWGRLVLGFYNRKHRNEESKNEAIKGDGNQCPYCAKSIKSEAKICKYCGKDISNTLEQDINCPLCGAELRLDRKERIERKFLCANCGKPVDMRSSSFS